jgi:hypothetical protein
MAHDVFISYAVEDKEVADKVRDALERGGIPCWIAPRDVPIGVSYEQAILDAIEASTFLVLLFSAHANASHHVEREIRKAFEECSRTQVFPFRLEDVPYNKTLYYYLGGAQWVDASTPPLEQHLGRLVEHVRSHLSRAGDAAQPPVEVNMSRTPFHTPTTAAGRRSSPAVWIAAGVGALVLVALVVALIAMRRRSGDDSDNTPPRNVNVNVNASPTPHRTPSPTPTPNASPTPSPRPPLRNVNLSRNFNLRRVPEVKP